jgi:hypothetical protein
MICIECNIDKAKLNFGIASIYKGKTHYRKMCKKCKQLKDLKKGRVNRELIGRQTLNDYYIRQIEKFKKDTPAELIELKRQLLILKRTIYEHIQRSNPDGNRFKPEAIGRRNGYKIS